MRINKFLAECGLASRRHSEQIILDGRVTVNGKIVTNLSTEIQFSDSVTVDGKKVKPISKHVYLMLHKPKGYVTTVSDEKDRRTVMDLVRKDFPNVRLFPIGRLDYDTEGLLLLTTDGALCNRITHPRNEIEKIYSVRVEGEIGEMDLNKLRNGVEIDGVMTSKCRAKFISFDSRTKQSKIEITITEGLNRQVRRMFETIGKTVVFLKRVAIGSLRLGGLSRGEYRRLTLKEVSYLENM